MQPESKYAFLLKKSHLVDLLIVKNLPILGSFYQVLVFVDTRNGTLTFQPAKSQLTKCLKL